ncbi:MAG TPA: sulfatase-like hydrolase/transferase, partial [Acidobacteriota bacterium]|nr:sulfatase-like hydrolase/transferase [Acidobacteriota bacterium]
MIKLLYALFALVLCSACVRSNGTSDQITRNLADDFPYAQQSTLAASGRVAFSPGEQFLRAKKHPALAQHLPGELSFFTELPPQSNLRFSTRFLSEGKAAPPPASVTLESDFPTIMQEKYTVSIGREQDIDLSSFAQRIVRIRFSAGAINSEKLGGTLLWLNPSIESRNAQKQPDPQQWDTFRKRQKGRNVLLFILDAASADHFSCYGYSRKTTPVIDSLAAEGILFENAICPIPSTRPSTATLLSGLYPEVHGIMTMTKTFPEQLQTLPQLFQSAGYTTALFSGNPGGSMGYRNGFRLVATGPRSRKA